MMENSETDYLVRLGERIRSLRKEQGISLRKFGMMIGVDYSYLSEIENGKANASMLMLRKIANGLGVDAKDLF